MVRPSPRYIHFRVRWQILGPDSPGQRFARTSFEDFFHKLNKDKHFAGYDDFSYRPERCELAQVRGSVEGGGQAFSKVVYDDDKLTIVDEWTELNAAEFAKRLKVVLDSWFDCFPQTLAVAQNSWIRALITPANFQDSREFVSNGILKLGKTLDTHLNQRPFKVGFTFGCQQEHSQSPLTLECEANSWRDKRSVWIEVRSLALLRQPLNAPKHDHAEPLFERGVHFLETEVLPLLNSFDIPRDGSTTEGVA